MRPCLKTKLKWGLASTSGLSFSEPAFPLEKENRTLPVAQGWRVTQKSQHGGQQTAVSTEERNSGVEVGSGGL